MDVKSSDLVKIIEACGKNGVSRLKINDIEMTFNGFVIHEKSDYPDKVPRIEDNVQVDPKFAEQLEYDLAEMENEQLMIEDPLAYEEMLVRDDVLEDAEKED